MTPDAPAPVPDDPPAEIRPAEDPDEAAAPPEVVVWGRLAVDRARDALVRRIEALGYREVRRRDDAVVLASGDWRGRVVVTPDGALSFTRPIAGFGSPDPSLYAFDPSTDLPGPSRAAATGPGAGVTLWVLPSAEKRAEAHQFVFDATTTERVALRSIVERTAQEEWLEALPERLDRLWTLGEPLAAGAPLVAVEDRPAAVLGYWASRPDDPFGLRVTEVVEAWMVANLPAPSDPERYRAARADGRPLPGWTPAP